MQTLPFSEFLDALRDKDFGVGLHEYMAAGRLLQHWDQTNRAELRNSLAALIARREDEVETIRRLFDEFYPEAPKTIVKPPETPPETRGNTGRRWLWAAAAVLVIVAAVLVDRTVLNPPVDSTVSPTVTDGPPTDPAETIRPTTVELVADPLAAPPAVDLPSPPSRRNLSALALMGLAVFALTALPLWWSQMREATRRWTTEAWGASLAALPGPFHADFKLKDLETRLPRADIEEAATILGRSFHARDEQRSGTLDVMRTLHATIRAGMRPHLIFKARRRLQPILVLQDVSQSMAVHTRRVDGLIHDLSRQGIAIERWFFDGDISRPATRRYGPPMPLETLLRRRDDGPVMILGTGLGLAASLSGNDLGWLDALRQQSRRVWVNPVSDPSLWPKALLRLPVPAVAMTRGGLLQASRKLTQDDRTAFRSVDRAPRVVTAAHVEQLRRLASLVPHPTVDLLELLRQRFAPEIPESAVLRTAGPLATAGNQPLRLPDEEIRDLLADVRAHQPALEARVRSYLLKVLADSEPAPGSAAHMRWQASVALQRVQLADVQGGDASASIETLRALHQGPLWEEIREMVARQPARSAPSAQLRASVRADKAADEPPSIAFRWTPPGWRVTALATAAGVLVVLGAMASGSFVNASAHLDDAYQLEYVDASAGGPGAVRIRRLVDNGAPDTVRLYRGSSPAGDVITLSGLAPVTVPIEAGTPAAIYQVRASLPTGALALSNTLWAPSVLVVIDARPWANVTITSAEAGVNFAHSQTTPFGVRIPAGAYTVALENQGLNPASTERLVVAQDGSRSFTFTMPGFNLDQTLQQLGVVTTPPRSSKKTP